MDGPHPIETERLRLRPFASADAKAVARLAGDREIAAGTLTVPHPYPPGAAEAWIATHADRFRRGTSVIFAIVARDTGELVGAIGIELDRDHARGELGYWIGTDHWGRGFATEAARAVLAHGFRALGLQRIHAAYFAYNPRSGRVLEKLGLTREGTLRRHYRKGERFVDTVVMGMLREEFEAWEQGR